LVEFVAQEFKKQKRKIFYGEPAGSAKKQNNKQKAVNSNT